MCPGLGEAQRGTQEKLRNLEYYKESKTYRKPLGCTVGTQRHKIYWTLREPYLSSFKAKEWSLTLCPLFCPFPHPSSGLEPPFYLLLNLDLKNLNFSICGINDQEQCDIVWHPPSSIPRVMNVLTRIKALQNQWRPNGEISGIILQTREDGGKPS